MGYIRDAKGVIYDEITKKRLRDPVELERIRQLHIPPAYQNVYISKDPKEKIQAYGYDSKGRKQIRYHPDYVATQKQQRFQKIVDLDEVIQGIQEECQKRLQSRKYGMEQEIAAILLLMMDCHFRIGNEEYLQKYGTYGVTTLLWDHVEFHRKWLKFEFVGKKGVINVATCEDPFLVRYFHKIRERYQKDRPRIFTVSSTHVNQWLQKQHPDITSKDIRTWRANHVFLQAFRAQSEDIPVDKRVRNAIKEVATALHNTVAVCKSSYLHPDLLQVVTQLPQVSPQTNPS